jgi:hypothetical protein
MEERLRQRLTRNELENGVIPQNHIMVEMVHSCEGIKSKGNIVVGFNLDDEYDDETTSHKADLTEVYAKVVRLPERLYFAKDDPHSMPWDCDQDLMINDTVFFNIIESRNSVEIECEDKLYKILPYQDLYCAKRGKEVIMLNGYVLCHPVYTSTSHELAIDDKKEDKTRGRIAFVGKPNRQYQKDEYIDFVDLRVGDLVVFNPNSPVFRLERMAAIATFDGNNLYNVIQRRRIGLVAERG